MIQLSQNPKYFIYRDLIGLKVQIKSKNNSKNEFIPAGIVIDETYNTIITSQELEPKNYLNNNKKEYVKKNNTFRFELQTDKEILIIEVDGEKVLKKPENRIKLLKKENWRR
jgi:RNase P/RNase MRP subunit p29